MKKEAVTPISSLIFLLKQSDGTLSTSEVEISVLTSDNSNYKFIIRVVKM